MGELLSRLIPLSLGAAVSPTVLALELVILSGKRAAGRATAFLAGVLLVFVGLTTIGLLLSHSASTSSAPDTITKAVDGTAGTLLLLLALGTVLRALTRENVSQVDDEIKDTHDPGLLSAFLLGLAIMVTNFSTILLYLPAMRLISTAHISTDDKVFAVVLAFLITTAPILAIYGFAVGFPRLATPPLARLRRWIDRHQRTIGIAIEVIFGTYLLVKAFR